MFNACARCLPLLTLTITLAACAVRDEARPTRTLGRVFERLDRGEETTIAYFGGSITQAEGWRTRTFAWFRTSYPQARINQINAGVGGTGSDLGAFRCASDVIARRPHLVFVEFNVNDGFPADEFHKATMEGIVRQLWASESSPEIVFVYATDRSLKRRHDSHSAVARHYRIPEIDLQSALLGALRRSDLPTPTEQQRSPPGFDWRAPGQVFMNDAVHPSELGQAIYADAIIAYLSAEARTRPSPPPTLGPPLVSEEFANVKLVPPTAAKLIGDWEVLSPAVTRRTYGRYRAGAVNARKPGDALAVWFDGTAIGLYLSPQDDGGHFTWTIDDGKDAAGDRPAHGPRGRKHGQGTAAAGPTSMPYGHVLLSYGLPLGRHVLRLQVTDDHDAATTRGHRFLLGYVTVGGTTPTRPANAPLHRAR